MHIPLDAQTFSKGFLRAFGVVDKRTFCTEMLRAVTMVAVLILLILGATGVISPFAVGIGVVGAIGAGTLLLLAGGRLKERAFSIIVASVNLAIIATLGCLGASGVLLGSTMLTFLFAACIAGCFLECMTRSFVGVILGIGEESNEVTLKALA